MEPNTALETFLSQFTAGGLITVVLEYLKRAKWFPVLDRKSDKINVLAGATLAALAALGITVHFDQATGVATITGLTVASIWSFAVVWVKSWVYQELLYRGIVKKEKE